MHLTFAPLHGFTDATFRNVFFRHFGGIDEVIAPFISLTHGDKITPLKVRDLAASRHPEVRLVPQILGNDAGDFILLANYLADEMGFDEVNWNLGCPIRSIVNKKRGSGMLPYPDLLRSLLVEIVPALHLQLSIKLRLGYRSVEEFPAIVNLLNDFPLKNVCIHARIGIQEYSGDVLLDELDSFLPLLRHKVIYNGDIHSYERYHTISRRYPSIDSYMLGRGMFSNPFLAEMIRAGEPDFPLDARKRFQDFYLDLETDMKKSRRFWMSKMKEFWKSFGILLEADPAELTELLRCTNPAEWEKRSRKMIEPTGFQG